jgi:phage shock protein A
MSFFKNLYKKGEEKINELKVKYSDPVKEFANELAKLKSEHELIKKFIAQLKAMRIRSEKDIEAHLKKIEEYDLKAKETVVKSKKGEINNAVSENVALNFLNLKKAYSDRIDELKIKIPQYDEEIRNLSEKSIEFDNKIKHYSKEYEFLKTQDEIKKSRLDIDKNLFFDDSSIISNLEQLKKRISETEYKSDFYSKYSEKFSDNDIKNHDINEELKNIRKNTD